VSAAQAFGGNADGAAQKFLDANSRHPHMRGAQKEEPPRSNVFIEVSIGGNGPQRMTIEVGKLYRAAMSISSL
jgi:hypothetical protein